MSIGRVVYSQLARDTKLRSEPFPRARDARENVSRSADYAEPYPADAPGR